MMGRELGRVPGDSGDQVSLLQCLVDQELSSLARRSQHGDLHPQIVLHCVHSALILRSSVLASSPPRCA